MSTKTKITVVAAILLSSVSGAFASEAFDVDINRPAVTQSRDAYAHAPAHARAPAYAPRAQVERQTTPQVANATTTQQKPFFDHGMQID